MVTKVSVNGEEAVEIQDAGAREILAQRKTLKYVCIFSVIVGGNFECRYKAVVPMMLGVDEEITSLAQIREKIKNWTYDSGYPIPAVGTYYASNVTPSEMPITGIYYGSDNGLGFTAIVAGTQTDSIIIHDAEVKEVFTQEI